MVGDQGRPLSTGPMKKARIPCGVRASFEPALASWEGVRLRASLARMHLVLVALQPETGGRSRQMQVRCAAIQNLAIQCQTDRIRATHGRATTRGGAKLGGCKSAGVHDGSLMKCCVFWMLLKTCCGSWEQAFCIAVQNRWTEV